MSKRFRPMLAAPVDLDKLRYPVYISPKLDGIRATVVKGRLVSRTVKPIPNHEIRNFFSRIELEGIDGELIVGSPTAKDVFQRSTSGVMTREGKPRYRYYLFDVVEANASFFVRRSRLQKLVGAERIKILPQKLIINRDALVLQHQKNLGKGYEGSIIRSLQGLYKFGRSTVKEGYLLKWKPMEDAEAEVIGFEEKLHNGNKAKLDERGYTKRSSHKAGKRPAGTLGKLVVRNPKWPKEFRIGGGFTDSQRADIWKNKGLYLGKLVRFKFQRVGTKDLPRIAIFTGFRDQRDIT